MPAGEPFAAFISYSRGASERLATDLQSGLERFAKPWYRLRAMRVFRDDSSMSANTALWATIQTGLTQSGWFILLASPASAASPWVAQEIDWWLRHKGTPRLLIVQAEGELYWDRARGAFAPSSTAIPPILQHAYPEEPRWIDLRWYAADPSRGRTDPRFVERVADLAAAVRGIERDTLVGENVRQHRRSVRLARSAIVVLSLLLVLSLVAGVVALNQRREAVAQRNAAQTQAAISQARQLAATSRTLLTTDVAKARLIAVQAYRRHADTQTESALLASLTAAPQLVRSFPMPEPVFLTAGSRSADRVFAATRGGLVTGFTVADGARRELGSIGEAPLSLAASADGSLVAATTAAQTRTWLDGTELPLPAGLPADRLGLALSPSGRTVVVAGSVGDGGLGLTVLSRSGTEWRTVRTLEVDTPVISELTVPDDTSLAVWVGSKDSGDVDHYHLATGRRTSAGRGGVGSARQQPGALSADGRYVAVPAGDNSGVMPIYRTDGDYSAEDATPDRIGYTTGQGAASVALSPSGARSAYLTADAVHVAPTQTPGPDPFTVTMLTGSREVGGLSLTFVNERHLLSGSVDALLLWDLDQRTALVSRHLTTVPELAQVDIAPRIVPNPTGTAYATTPWQAGFSITDATDGSVITAGDRTTFLAWRDEVSLFYADGADGRVRLYDVAARKMLGDFAWSWPRLPEGQRFDVTTARYLPGTRQLAVAGAGRVLIMDAGTGAEVVLRDDLDLPSVSANGRYGFGLRNDRPTVVDLATGSTRTVDAVPDPDYGAAADYGVSSGYEADVLVTLGGVERLRTFWSADGSTRLGSGPSAYLPAPLITVHPSGTRYAETRADGSVALVELGAGQPLGSFAMAEPGTRVSYAFSGDGTRLLLAFERVAGAAAAGPNGELISIDLRPDTWIAAACTSAGRDLAPAEWVAITGQPAPDSLRCSG